ncbi:unnamed protein product [Victoria cruziana]
MFRGETVRFTRCCLSRPYVLEAKCLMKCSGEDFTNLEEASLWNAILQGCMEKGAHVNVLSLYRKMRLHGVNPDHCTLSFVLKLCKPARGTTTSLALCRETHGGIIKCGHQPDLLLATSLVEAYSAWRCVMDARKVFDEMRKRDVVAWNVMIHGYVKSGDTKSAVSLFCEMPQRSNFSWNMIIAATARCGNLEGAEKLFAIMPHKDAVSLNVMITGYSQVGNLEKARELFESASVKDLVTWNSIVGAYAGNGHPKEALMLFKRMWAEHVEPDGFTLTTILSACARVGDLDTGEWIWSYTQRKGVAFNYMVGAAFVDMFSKCGRIKSAQEVFELATKCDVSVWNAMIGGLAMHGRAEDAFELFNQMLKEQIEPDAITFLSILNACSHAGLVERGQTYFDTMRSDYLIVPQIEHYGAMVDLLGRAGRVDEAYSLIKSMDIQPDAVIWRALLGACRIHGNVKLGEMATKQILKLEQRNSGDYVLLSNIYSTSSKWHDAENAWNAMKQKGIPKNPGLSWIKVNNEIHEFVAGDRTNSQSESIYRTIVEVMKQIKMVGFMPATDAVTHDVSEEEKEDFLYCHSEKLALAFGLLNTSPRSTIRIYKNLRICHDCHSVMKFVSKLYSREIIIRDRIRFHHFAGGACSCKDYW